MRLLLDTHVVLWVLAGSRISKQARTAIADPENMVHLSAASVWEVSIKRGLGRLTLPEHWLDAAQEQGIEILPITAEHALAVGDLPPHHRDPFDRMLVAQARAEGLTVVTRDGQLSLYDVSLLSA